MMSFIHVSEKLTASISRTEEKHRELSHQLTARQQRYILPLRPRSLLCSTQVAPGIISVSTGVSTVSPVQKPLQII